MFPTCETDRRGSLVGTQGNNEGLECESAKAHSPDFHNDRAQTAVVSRDDHLLEGMMATYADRSRLIRGRRFCSVCGGGKHQHFLFPLD